MISKERLQELINQDATIYWITSSYYLYPAREKIRALKLNKNFCLKDKRVGCCLVEIINGRDDIHLTINCYYETKEDALWNLEMTATRTETLKMPKWEEFIGKLKGHFIFIDKYGNMCSINGYNDENGGFIDVCVYLHQKVKFDYNKENYIEACKLCLKLFKGEK